MKLRPQCMSCVLRQLAEASGYATGEARLRYNALEEIIRYLNTLDLDHLDIKIGRDLHEIVRKVTGNPDPYSELKRSSNRMALDWFSRNGRALENGVRFDYAVRLAAAANIIDYGALRTRGSPEEPFAKAVKRRVNPMEVARLERLVRKSSRVLYICHNAGEIAFDKLLVSAIQHTGASVTVVVRGGPIINDATMDDARAVGMTKLARTISTGTDVCGILLEESSSEFLNAFHKSDLIISKGQANLESLVNIRGKTTTAYILKVKCKLVSEYLRSRTGWQLSFLILGLIAWTLVIVMRDHPHELGLLPVHENEDRVLKTSECGLHQFHQHDEHHRTDLREEPEYLAECFFNLGESWT